MYMFPQKIERMTRPVSLTTRKMQIKTIMKYHFLCIKRAIMKTYTYIDRVNDGGNLGILEFQCSLVSLSYSVLWHFL